LALATDPAWWPDDRSGRLQTCPTGER